MFRVTFVANEGRIRSSVDVIEIIQTMSPHHMFQDVDGEGSESGQLYDAVQRPYEGDQFHEARSGLLQDDQNYCYVRIASSCAQMERRFERTALEWGKAAAFLALVASRQTKQQTR
jgi:hypothetical protein